MVPKRIIQTYKNRRSLAALHFKCHDELRRHHPDHEFLAINNRDCRLFIREKCPGFLPLWDFYPRGVQRSDLFRVLAVYHLGGFYFDTDVYFHEPLPPDFGKPLIFPLESTMSAGSYLRRHRVPASCPADLDQMGNYAFGAVAGHWFLREVLEEMVRRTGEVDMGDLADDDVLYSTGPDVVNGVARAHRRRLREDLELLRGEDAPREPVAEAVNHQPHWFQFGRYANHLMSGSWRTLSSGRTSAKSKKRPAGAGTGALKTV